MGSKGTKMTLLFLIFRGRMIENILCILLSEYSKFCDVNIGGMKSMLWGKVRF